MDIKHRKEMLQILYHNQCQSCWSLDDFNILLYSQNVKKYTELTLRLCGSHIHGFIQYVSKILGRNDSPNKHIQTLFLLPR